MTAHDSDDELQPLKIVRRRDDLGIMAAAKLIVIIWAAMAPILAGAAAWVTAQINTAQLNHQAQERELYVRRSEYESAHGRLERIVDEIRLARERDHDLLQRIANKVGAER